MFKVAPALLLLGSLFSASAEIAQGIYDIAPFQNVPAAAGPATFISGSNRVVGESLLDYKNASNFRTNELYASNKV